MTKRYSPKGVLVAMVTPFGEDESLDLQALDRHTEYLIEAGVHGLVPIAGSGEYVSLSPSERELVIRHVIDVARGRLPVTVGALAPTTKEVIETGLAAAKFGADALLVLPPYYIGPSAAGVCRHFEQVTRTTNLPVVVYNNPSRTGRPIGLDLLLELAAVPGVIGIKDCERDAGAVMRRIAALNGQIAYLCGDDDVAFEAFLGGADGAVMTLPNLAPKLALKLFAACMRGDVAAARQEALRIIRLSELARMPNHPGPLKEAMAMVGRPVGAARMPLMPMNEVERLAAAEIHRELEDYLN